MDLLAGGVVWSVEMQRDRTIVIKDQTVSLLDCPPGLFVFEGEIGFKAEYHSNLPDRMEVYCVSSGEEFWGDTTCWWDRALLHVYPAYPYMGD